MNHTYGFHEPHLRVHWTTLTSRLRTADCGRWYEISKWGHGLFVNFSSPHIVDSTSSHTCLCSTSVVIVFRETMAQVALISRPPTSNVIDMVDLVVRFHSTTVRHVPGFITEPRSTLWCDEIFPTLNHVLGMDGTASLSYNTWGFTPLYSLRNSRPSGWCGLVDGSVPTILSRTMVVVGYEEKVS